jgi:ribosome-associated toxin RatA of RatAB toxin-antitoxin module
VNIHFNHTAPTGAPAETLFGVIADYPHYPRFNSAVVKVTVVTKSVDGAEFLADRRTRIGKQVRAFDRYERDGDLVITRTYGPGSTGRSTWTIHPVDAGRSTLTIDASMTVPLLKGLVARPFLRRLSTASTSRRSSRRPSGPPTRPARVLRVDAAVRRRSTWASGPSGSSLP